MSGACPSVSVLRDLGSSGRSHDCREKGPLLHFIQVFVVLLDILGADLGDAVTPGLLEVETRQTGTSHTLVPCVALDISICLCRDLYTHHDDLRPVLGHRGRSTSEHQRRLSAYGQGTRGSVDPKPRFKKIKNENFCLRKLLPFFFALLCWLVSCFLN